MKLLEVADEFSNLPVTLDHLFRVQVARCAEFVRYFNFLKDKHSDWPARKILLKDSVNVHSFQGASIEEFKRNITHPGVLLSKEIDKLVMLKSRVINAKRAYENAGGVYAHSPKVLEVADEFSNQEITLDHLFRIQNARFNELMIYWKQMNKKHPRFLANPAHHRRLDSRSHFAAPSHFKDVINPLIFSQNDVNKLVAKYERMLDAKRAFEHAGGKYLQPAE